LPFKRLTGVDPGRRLRYRRAMSLLRGLFWLILFAFFTFCFIVLFEYGTHDFTTGFKKEAERVKDFVVQATNKPATDKSPGEKKK
jgi:hypothetical protein